MHVRWAAALVVMAAVVGLPHAAHAAEAYPRTVMVDRAGGWTTYPAAEYWKAPIQYMGASVTIPAGQTRYLSSDLVLYGAKQVTAVAARLDCRTGPWSADPASVVDRAIGGQNVLRTERVVMRTRALFTAPASSDLICSLDAQFVNHEQVDQFGRIFTSGESFLRDMSGSLPWGAQGWQDTTKLVDRLAAVAGHRSVLPAGLQQVKVAGDASITVCYGDTATGPCSHAARRGFRSAYVGTQLMARRFDAAGRPCGSVWTNGPLAWRTITNAVHHFKINMDGVVPRDPSCPSRRLDVWVRVAVSATGNSVVVDSNRQSVTLAVP